MNERRASRYYTSYLMVKNKDGDSRRQLVGLVGLVVMTKELPNWFWAALEHVDNLGAHSRATIAPTAPGERW